MPMILWYHPKVEQHCHLLVIGSYRVINVCYIMWASFVVCFDMSPNLIFVHPPMSYLIWHVPLSCWARSHL